MGGWFQLPPGSAPAPGVYLWRQDASWNPIKVTVQHGLMYVNSERTHLHGGEWKELASVNN